MTDAPAPQAAPAAPAPAPKARRRFRVSKTDALLVALLANFGLGTAALVRTYVDEKPTIVTVGVRQLTADYVVKTSNQQMSATEIRQRTDLFLAVAQDSMKRMATEKGVVVLARECVLGGEYADLTQEVSQTVNAALAKASGGLAHAVPSSPSPAASLLAAAPQEALAPAPSVGP